MANHSLRSLLCSVLLSIAAVLPVSSSDTTRSPEVFPATPSKELAIQLLTLRDERFAKDYTVALIMPGETQFKGLTVAHAASVSFFGPEIDDGKKKRQLQSETLLWNEEYGWFLCEFGERLGRTTVFIWSELKGEVEID